MRNLFLIFSLILIVSSALARSTGYVDADSIRSMDHTKVWALPSGTGTLQGALSASTATRNGYLASSDWATFNSKQGTLNQVSGTSTGYLTSADWITFNSKQGTLNQASGTSTGYLISADWTVFNGKQGTLSAAGLHSTGYLTSTDWATFNSASGGTTYSQASSVVNGYLASSDWVTFNGAASGYATTATSGGTTTLDNMSSPVQYFTGSSGHTIVLPVASTLTVGRKFKILNASTGVVDVQTSGGNLFLHMQSSANSIYNPFVAEFTCVDTAGGTGLASWSMNEKPSLSTASTANSLVQADGVGTVTASTFVGALTGNATNITTKSTASVGGYLSSVDWTTFNSKQGALQQAGQTGTGYLVSADWITFNGKSGPLNQAGLHATGYLTSTDWASFNSAAAGGITSVTATSPITSSGGQTPNIALVQASGSVAGYLSSVDWVTFNNKANSAINQNVTCSSPNGFGSTNTVIRRWTNCATTGTAITYADSATNGATFTINTAGLYTINYADFLSGQHTFGLSLNATSFLTTTINSVTPAQGKIAFSSSTSTGQVSKTIRLAVNDVIRCHTDGTQSGTGDSLMFTIIQIGN